MSIPDFVAIGHLCCDLVNGRQILGGSASYSGLTAYRLGKTVGILTAVADDFPFLERFKGITISNVGSSSTTTFRNTYQNGTREQFVSSVAASICSSHIPKGWEHAGILYLCPIAGEVMDNLIERFTDSLIGVGAQGWLRTWDDTGRVRKKKWEHAEAVARSVDVIIFSELDMEEPYVFAEDISCFTPIVIVTQSARGAELFLRNRRVHVPAYGIEEIDPTGAGDVFAAAFLLRYKKSGDPVEAANFACCTASFICEKEGTEGVPTLQQVLKRM